jgi:hypothetical protein
MAGTGYKGVSSTCTLCIRKAITRLWTPHHWTENGMLSMVDRIR